MPPTRAARRSGRNTAATNRAASVPVSSRGENPVLESLRLKQQSLALSLANLEIEDVPPSSLHTTSASVAAMTVSSVGTSEQRPQKRRKRSSSTPAVSRPSQPPVPLPSRRRSRSRGGSPTSNADHVPRTRVSARLARKIQPFLNSRNSDIYMHLAGPDGTGTLLNGSPAETVISSTAEVTPASQPRQGSRGRQRKDVCPKGENAKKDLMEEWARMRRSRGSLSLSGIDENTSFSKIHPRDARNNDGSVPLEPMAWEHSSNPEPVDSQGTTLSDGAPLSIPMDSENALLMHTDQLPSGIEQRVVPSVPNETPPTSILGSRVNEGSSSDVLVNQVAHGLHLPLRPVPSLPTLSVLPMQKNSVLTDLAMNEQAETISLNNPSKDSHSAASQAYFAHSSIHLDLDAGFYMLDIPDVFALPWEPVESHLYVPPGLGKLISGMREQLAIEARARRRAEELYQAELSRRISAEKIIQDLQAELARRRRTYS